MSKLIQWPRAKYWDLAWNPIVGCHPCSPACKNCYAAAWAKRFGLSFTPHASGRMNPPRKGVVFCGNMTDLFGEWHTVNSGFYLLSKTWTWKPGIGPVPFPATYLWLTKRVERMRRVLENYTECPHSFFGYTAENQEWYERRFAEFKKIPTRFKGWLSAEPLLGPLDRGLRNVYPPEAMPFQWVVVGCESGPNRRPCGIGWVESIVAQCRSAGVPVFVKQLDLDGRCERDISKFPKHLRIRQVPWAEKGGPA